MRFLVSHLHPISIEDLLERDEIHLDTSKVEPYLKDKVVLVTGAGGSIGSEICRQVLRVRPKKLLLLGHGEIVFILFTKSCVPLCLKVHWFPLLLIFEIKIS